MIFCTIQEWWEIAQDTKVFSKHTEWDVEVWHGGDWRNVDKIWPVDGGEYHISPHGLQVKGSTQICLKHRVQRMY